MRYLLWVAGILTLYVFHEVFSVGRRKSQHFLAFAEKYDVSDVGLVDVIS
jgi:hypothetical protein